MIKATRILGRVHAFLFHPAMLLVVGVAAIAAGGIQW